MKEFVFKIGAKNGLHARPAGTLATVAKEFDCDITAYKGEKRADCKRILGVMALGAIQGDEIRFVIDGADEDGAFAAIQGWCRHHLGGE